MSVFHRFATRTVAVGLALILSGGCSLVDRVFPDRTQDYKSAKVNRELDVPPDLVTTTLGDALPDEATRLSEYAGSEGRAASDSALTAPENVSFHRDRDRVWLDVNGDPDKVWSRARDFWQENGFLLVRDDPQIGVLETDWAERPLNAPSGAVRKVIDRVWDTLHSASTRDKFRMRMERGEAPGSVELYITHRGIQEQLQGTAEQVQTAKWKPRPSDPDLEAEMARRLMVFLGVEEGVATDAVAAAQPPAERAELIKESKEKAWLRLREDFPNAWRSVGIALDRIGFAVEDRNRSEGLYYVKYTDLAAGENKKGVLSKLAFWSDDDESAAKQHQIKLESENSETRISVLDADGKPEFTQTAVRILTLLHEQLR